MVNIWKEYQLNEFHKAMEKAEKVLEQALDELQTARHQVREWNEQDELKKKDELIAQLSARTFAYSPTDWEEVELFTKEHYNKNRVDRKQPSHVITHEFTDTEVGLIATVRCSCGEYKNFFY